MGGSCARVRSTIRLVHLRRALLLFAIVLGLAAVAASVTRSHRNGPVPSLPAPATRPVPGTSTPARNPDRRTLRFEQGGHNEVRRLRADQAATVLVAVDSAGQAELEGVGVWPAEPETPAAFEVFVPKPGTYPVLFHPAAGGRAERVGTLRVLPKRTAIPP